jgi:predicted hydrocarbon binding protein
MSDEYDFIQTFDPVRKLQYVNSDPSVMHCHHYATLYTKLALDFSDFGIPYMLRDSMEEASYLVLKKAFLIRDIKDREKKKNLAEEHFRLAGLGRVSITLTGNGGTARMNHSHMDEGWISKWGRHDEPVNFIGQGYLAAAFALIFEKRLRSFSVRETESIVSGNSYSSFTITPRRDNQYGN